MARWLGAAVAAICTISAGFAEPALAARVAVLDRLIGASAEERPPLFETAARRIHFRIGLAAAESASRIDAVQRCGADLECAGARLKEAGFDLGVAITANLGLSPPLLSVVLFEAGTGHPLGKSVQMLEAAGALVPELEREFDRLLDEAHYALGARLLLDVAPPGAQVEVDGAPVQQSTLPSLLVSAGAHRLHVSLDGFEESETQPVALPGSEIAVPIRLEPSRSILRSGWFWTGVGVAVVGGTIAAVVLGSSGPISVCQPKGPLCN